jgi:hypothetical protein
MGGSAFIESGPCALTSAMLDRTERKTVVDRIFDDCKTRCENCEVAQAFTEHD